MKNFKGITLIALIITIIVMLILVGVTINVAINGGLIGRGKEASFKTMMSQYKEQVEIYMVDKRLGDYLDDATDLSDINAGATDRTPKMEMKDIIGSDVKKGYEDKIAVEMGELYYVPTNLEDNNVKNEIKWCFEIGIKVKGYDSYEDFILETGSVSGGDYEEIGEIYVNTPDLTGFSKANTYYVTYDDQGKNETIGGRIVEEAPKGWYDYKNKIWANVVTKSGQNMAYWVWIPRYAYKITYYTDSALSSPSEGNAVTQYGDIDVKFLSKGDIYKEKTASGEIIQKTLNQLQADGYILPESFTWDEQPLSGYWVSKYEVSGVPYFNIEKTITGEIKISSIKNSTGPYKYYLDGELKYTGTDLYTFTDLIPNKIYEIKIEDNIGYTMVRKVFAEEVILDSTPKTAPDLSGFKKTNAYYVTYDDQGENETIGNKIEFNENGEPTNIPNNWYNYKDKIWANIVTSDQELTDADKANINNVTDKKIAYWVWIPRYEYKIVDLSKESDYMDGDKLLTETLSINFIDTNTTTPTKEGYKISEAFTWDEQPLSGYWVSKYEVSE